MLTKKTLEKARELDRAYGGDGNCSHRFGGPEPERPPVHWQERESVPKSSSDEKGV